MSPQDVSLAELIKTNKPRLLRVTKKANGITNVRFQQGGFFSTTHERNIYPNGRVTIVC